MFKSGNSLALRLPKALGLEAGMEMELTADGVGGYALRRVEAPRRKIDISGFAGKLPGFKPAPREDFEERPSTIAAREAARRAAEGK
ncbi:MAG: AbrB/MazE/SpoVT family DNA-binding domain-containing protein [Proteobacteria bacterium]|nr:AbrB/MazE/SpoVT family DNA-binding domain-containing protein [Pseudomonadota bacterium]